MAIVAAIEVTTDEILAAETLCRIFDRPSVVRGVPVFLGGNAVLIKNKCATCKKMESPVWRRGWPLLLTGHGSTIANANMCNACGIKFKKSEAALANNLFSFFA